MEKDLRDKIVFERRIRKIVENWYYKPLMSKDDLVYKLVKCFENARKTIRRL